MKKLLLSVLSLCFVATSMFGQIARHEAIELPKMAKAPVSDDLQWLTNATDVDTYYSLGAGLACEFGAVSCFTPDRLSAYDGLQVSVINIGVANTVSDATIFVMQGSSPSTATEIASKKVSGLSSYFNYVKLDAPFTIDASENLYIGFKMNVDDSIYPLLYDGSGLEATDAGLSYVYMDGDYMDLSERSDFLYLGHPMIQALVGGDENKLLTVSVWEMTDGDTNVFKYQPIGSEVNPVVTFVNNSFCTVESMTVSYSVNGEVAEKTYTFSPAVASNSITATSIELPKIVFDGDVDYSYFVTQLNGQPIAEVGGSCSFYAYDKQDAVDRTLLMEKFYSQYCGYSPEGKEAIDAAVVGYEDRVARIYHHAGYRVDVFTIDESVETATAFGVFFSPATMGDRMWHYSLGNNVFNAMQWTGDLIAEYLQQDGLASLKISDSYDVETRELTVNVSGKCIVTPVDKKMTVVVTESNYSSFQSNAQNYKHDHFPILYLTAADGDDLQVNEDGSYDMTFKGVIPQSYNNGNGTIVTGNKVNVNLDELRIVAFIADGWDGVVSDRYVLNSATKEAATVGAFVAGVELPGVNVYGVDSRIVVEGDYDRVQVFNASGIETGTEGLSAGLYIVKVMADGQSMVKKVAVK